MVLLSRWVVFMFLLGSTYIPMSYATEVHTVTDLLDFSGTPRSAAMGSAFSAISSDIGAIVWNPAGLATSTTLGLFSVHAGHHLGAVIMPVPTGRAIRDQAEDISSKDVLRREQRTRAALALGHTGMDETVSDTIATSSIWLLSSAIRFRSKLAIGLSYKGIRYETSGSGWSDSARTGAVDLGLQYRLWDDSRITLDMGALMQNLRGVLKYDSSRPDGPLPTMFRTGMLLSIRFDRPNIQIYRVDWSPLVRLHLAGELSDSRRGIGGQAGRHMGLEVWLKDILAVRLGYLSEPHDGTGAPLSWGVGLRVPLSQAIYPPVVPDLVFDYLVEPGRVKTKSKFSISVGYFFLDFLD